VVVIDDSEVILGSTNWFYKDFHSNHQVNVKIRDPKLAKYFREYIEDKINASN